MASFRKIVFANEYYYHVFNRGIDRRITFTNKREYARAMELLFYYQFSYTPLRFSEFSHLNNERQNDYMKIMVASGRLINIIAYCLMPNHFHLLLKQKKDKGIAKFVANFTNAYTKYFNTKHERTGPLFQGVFKAVYVETDEQLLHLTRYIHLNPVVSSIIVENELISYPWSSYHEYFSSKEDNLVEKDSVDAILQQVPKYKSFVLEQIPYAKKLDAIKHLVLE